MEPGGGKEEGGREGGDGAGAGAASGAGSGRAGGGSASGALRHRRRSTHRLQGPAGPRPVSGAGGEREKEGGREGERGPSAAVGRAGAGGARPRLGPAGAGGLGSA